MDAARADGSSGLPMPAAPRVLVVIPTLNEAGSIAGVLDELRTDLPPGADVRFVVCDGGSSDDTRRIVETLARSRADLRLLSNPRRLQAAAINLAVRECGEGVDVLVRCDAHARYPRGFIARLLTSLDDHDADALVVPMDTTGDSCLRRAVAWVSDSAVGSGGSAHRGGRKSGFVDHGHHAAFRMESFRRAGGYDESFTHNEDAELDCRQRALGSRIYLDATIRLGYYPRGTLSGLAKQYFNYGKGRSRTVRRHPASMRLRQLLVPLHVVLCAGALAALPWTAWPMIWPVFYAGVLLVTSGYLALLHRSFCGFLGGVAAAVMHLAWGAGFVWGMATLRVSPWRPEEPSPPENVGAPTPLRDAST